MIRKLIIVVLTVGAVLAVCAGTVSYPWHAALHYYSAQRLEWWYWGAGAGKLFLRYETDVGSLEKEHGPGIYRLKLGSDSLFAVAPWGDRTITVSYGHIPATRYNSIPGWSSVLLGLALASYPIVAFIRGPLRRRRRRERGLCLKCGYDLRGSPGPRCPECGEAAGQV